MFHALHNVPRVIVDSGSSHGDWPVTILVTIYAWKGFRLHCAETHHYSLLAWIMGCLAGIPRVVPERILPHRLFAALQGRWMTSQLAVVVEGSFRITVYSGVQWQCRQLNLPEEELEYEPWKVPAPLLIISPCHSKPQYIANSTEW